MTIDITINGFVFALLTVAIICSFISLARWFYYRRLAVQMKLRAIAAETISKHVDEMKEKHTLAQHQKDFLNFILGLAHNNKAVVAFLHAFSLTIKEVKQGQNSKITKELEREYGGELLKDAAFLAFWCILHASTYSFFSGFRLRKDFFALLNFDTNSQESSIEDIEKIYADEDAISDYVSRILNYFPQQFNDSFAGTAKHA